MGLADELLEDCRYLAAKGAAEKRASCMRRAVSTAYYAIFHLLVEDFVGNWPFTDQRARLARMFDHKKMRAAAFTPSNESNPTPAEAKLMDVKTAFRQLQEDHHKADYDLSWSIVATDVANAITLAEDSFTNGDQSARRMLRGTTFSRCFVRLAETFNAGDQSYLCIETALVARSLGQPGPTSESP